MYPPQAQSQFESGTNTQTGTTNTNQQQSGVTSNVGQQSGSSQGTFLPGQQQLQGQVGNALGSVLSGQGIPGSSTSFIPQQTQAYVDNYNRYVAPQEAAQGGAGSPAIASNLALGLENLQGNLAQDVYNTNAGVFSSALGTGTSAAYNPTGQNTSGTTSGTTATTANSTQNTTQDQAGSWQANNDQTLGQLNALLGTFGSVGGLP